MNITLKDQSGSTYTLPTPFRVKSVEPFPLKRRYDSVERAYSDGSVEIGDRRVGERKIVVSGKVVTNDFATLLSNLMKQFIKDEELEFRYTTNRFARVRFESFEQENLLGPESGDRTSEFEFTFQMLDPFFYSNTAYNDTIPLAYSHTHITIPNSGDMYVYPVFTVQAMTPITSFSLSNLSDDNRIFYYQDTDFDTGSLVEIDCVNGVVERDGIDTIARFYGNFLRLNSGNNSMEYISNAVFAGVEAILLVEYRCRFLHAEGPDCSSTPIMS